MELLGVLLGIFFGIPILLLGTAKVLDVYILEFVFLYPYKAFRVIYTRSFGSTAKCDRYCLNLIRGKTYIGVVVYLLIVLGGYLIFILHGIL